LVKLFDGLNEQRKKSLLDYARYLEHVSSSDEPEQKAEKLQPLENSRPDKENVVNAIKRLRASYFMLNTDDLLNETSSLMAQFMIQGREADDVIDELEQVFDSHYKKYLQS